MTTAEWVSLLQEDRMVARWVHSGPNYDMGTATTAWTQSVLSTAKIVLLQ